MRERTEVRFDEERALPGAAIVLRATLLDSSNQQALHFRGRVGELHCGVGVRCVFEELRTSTVERLVWDGERFEVHTANSSYVFKVLGPR